VNAVEPKSGVHVWWDGLWMERAEGVSLNQLAYKRAKTFVAGGMNTLLAEKLNRTRVLRAALFDLLSSQCDRHGQNVFVNEAGKITLIDNLVVRLGMGCCSVRIANMCLPRRPEARGPHPVVCELRAAGGAWLSARAVLRC
jgi:hypothetical protein